MQSFPTPPPHDSPVAGSFSGGLGDILHAARQSAVAFDQDDLAKARVSGQDAALYLHRRLTNSVTTLSPGQGCEAALLGGDGRMILTLSAHRSGPEEFLVLADGALAERLVEQLEKYIITEDATVEDCRRRYGAIQILGPRWSDVAGALAGNDSHDLSPWGILPIPESSGLAGYCCRSDLGRIPGALALIDAEGMEQAWAIVDSRLGSLGGVRGDTTAWETLRVEEGEPRYGAEWDEKTIPLEVNLRRLLDYKKGCYPGQEIIARITNLGHPARALVGVRLSEALPAGTPLWAEGSEAGKITSSAVSGALGPVGLAMVAWNARSPETELSTPGGASARTVALPFDLLQGQAPPSPYSKGDAATSPGLTR